MDIKKRIGEIWNPDPRVDKILEENFYGYEVMFQYWEILPDLMHQDRKKPKIMGSLLTVKSHAGKTTIVKQFIASYLENVPGTKETDILYFTLIDRGTSFKSVIAAMCRELRIPDIPTNNDSWQTFIQIISSKKRR
ncbi:MAG: TniB family NTP-binding protein [Candidatus Hodarchaeota archaeon]